MAATKAQGASEKSLCDLLGRGWTVAAPARQLTFNAAESMVAFALANGTLALASLADPESSINRFHIAGDSGRATLTARQRPVPPLTEVAVDESDLHVAAFGADGFIAGGATGRLAVVSASGRATPFKRGDRGSVRAMVSIPGKGAVVGSGSALELYDAASGTAKEPVELSSPPTALACSNNGRWIAQSDEHKTSIRACNAELPVVSTSTAVPAALSLSWSPNGQWLAASLGAGGLAILRVDEGRIEQIVQLPNYPALVGSLDWDAGSRILATSGAFRIVLWTLDQFKAPLETPQSLVTGKGGLVVVQAVAMHPRRALTAAGFENGMVVVAQNGGRDELLVRPPLRGAVQSLRWSGDGLHLAFGTDGDDVGLITLPPSLFKQSSAN